MYFCGYILTLVVRNACHIAVIGATKSTKAEEILKIERYGFCKLGVYFRARFPIVPEVSLKPPSDQLAQTIISARSDYCKNMNLIQLWSLSLCSDVYGDSRYIILVIIRKSE